MRIYTISVFFKFINIKNLKQKLLQKNVEFSYKSNTPTLIIDFMLMLTNIVHVFYVEVGL